MNFKVIKKPAKKTAVKKSVKVVKATKKVTKKTAIKQTAKAKAEARNKKKKVALPYHGILVNDNAKFDTEGYKLPTKFKATWLKALRSGEYKQARGTLANFHGNKVIGYCCLGVAGHVCGISNKAMSNDSDLSYEVYGHRKTVPASFLKNQDLQGHFISLNDTYGYTFRDIAKWIEVNL